MDPVAGLVAPLTGLVVAALVAAGLPVTPLGLAPGAAGADVAGLPGLVVAVAGPPVAPGAVALVPGAVVAVLAPGAVTAAPVAVVAEAVPA